jgi:hypothetical protein
MAPNRCFKAETVEFVNIIKRDRGSSFERRSPQADMDYLELKIRHRSIMR